MILIAHRGNIFGPNKRRENKPNYIQEALNKNYHVEIDVWYISNKIYLGHDEPKYETDLEFLQSDNRIICHCKTVETLYFLLSNNLHCFFHDKDKATLTSQGKIWLYPGIETYSNGILVMPEWEIIKYKENTYLDFLIKNRYKCYGVCSDYVGTIKLKLIGSKDDKLL